ncbi:MULTISPECIES: DUF1540 domain-containing protein [unclassified Candidatus Frackibacter]|uniref:DUF1540 domain-containing protein n=1 Tax=unclassified Candidatus Frackibacter TaxID=2648818 RepID=UPI000883A965|nr:MULTISPECIES: DUF1540 domain-containing protein [unclassified Candidatus Frackibacter]SDC11620.1 protein of unknown function [Candidatus Frackibacter sp. WG11]SEM36371.1 protein of unknown function [Candidatus Frackibacter sp. WG12]SFL41621.1 protein of unknown function [Candidatus Frackibacter sp. WG13]
MSINENIKCTVSNCTYWDNKYCTASAIEVNVDGGGAQASNEEKTNCHTFESRS